MNKTDNTRDLSQSSVPHCPPYYCPEDEVDLAELVSVLARRRWTIFLTVLFVSASALLYCFVATPKYHIQAQIRPGITGYDEHGQPVYALRPTDIQEWFSKKAYMDIFTERMPQILEHAPKFETTKTRNGTVVSVGFYWPDPEEGKEIESLLIDHLSGTGPKSLEKSLAVSRRKFQEAIVRAQNEKASLDLRKEEIGDTIDAKRNQIKVLQAEITNQKEDKKQTKALIEQISRQIETVNKNTAELIQLRNKVAASSKEQLAPLMYSNIIQQNISYEMTLQQRLSKLRNDLRNYDVLEAKKEKELKDVGFAIKKLVTERDQRIALQKAALDQQIDTLRTNLSSLSPVEVIQPPFSSVKPEKPAKMKIVAVAFMASWFPGIFGAFLVEFWSKNRERFSG